MKIKNLKKIFSKTEKSITMPMSVITTVERPIQPVNRLSDDERNRLHENYLKENQIKKIDPYFIQEISDRLYGPDSDEYIKAIIDLNSKFEPRRGRTGPQIYRD